MERQEAMNFEKRRKLILLYKTRPTDELKEYVTKYYYNYRKNTLSLIKQELLRRNVIIPEDELPSESEMRSKILAVRFTSAVFIIVFLLIFGFAGHWMSSGSKSEPKSTPKPNGLSAYYQSCDYVRQRLKSSSSAKFPNPLNNRELIGVDLGEGRFKVSAYVDAKNSFGATTRSRYTCILKGIETVDGNRWILESIEFD